MRRFPITQLKIDRSFVSEMTENADDASIVGAIISLGRSLGLELVAEGVETRRQACLLRDMGCHTLQGFHFAHPTPADDIAALVRLGPMSFDAPHAKPAPALRQVEAAHS